METTSTTVAATAELEESEARQRSLGAAFEALNSQASAILHFTVEWKDLERHFESTRTALRTRIDELNHRLEEAAETEAKTARLAAEAEEREGHLESVRALIKENDEELRVREERYESLERLIREKEREAEEMERRVKERFRKLSWVEKRIEVKVKEVEDEVRRLESVRVEVVGVEKELEGKKEKVRFAEVEDEVKRLKSVREEVVRVEKELEGKKEKVRFAEVSIAKREEKLCGVKGLIVERRKELELKKGEVEKVERRLWLVEEEVGEKERRRKEVEDAIAEREKELGSVRGLVEECERELKEKEERRKEVEESIAEKEKELDGVRGMVEERRKEVEMKEGEMREVKRGIEECERELREKEERRKEVEESKEEMVRVAEAKREEFSVLKRSMEEWGCKVEEKKREVEEWVSKLELKEKEVESKMEELGLIRKELLDEVQFRERHLNSLEKSLVEWEKDLQELQKSVQECSRGGELSRDGRGLQLFMDEQLKRIDSLGTELSAILKESSDPGKLVLDAMQGFYPDNRESGFELRVRRRSCILLLEELMRISPQMNSQLKEEATRLAADWKAKMTVASDKDLEVLGFLRLVAAYGLNSAYDAKELRRLLSNVSHGLQAAEIGLALGITEPGSHICFPVKIEEPESSTANNAAPISSPKPRSIAVTDTRNSAANNAATISSPVPQSSATTDFRYSRGSINEHSSWNLDTIQNELVAVVQSASDPQNLVLMMMQNSLVKYWTSTEASLKKGVMSCIISLLKVLIIRVSPQLGSHVKEGAKKLGLEWKAKIRADAEHLLEIVAFLVFIVAYGLLSILTGDEIVKFLERLSQHKEAVESLQMYGFRDKILAVIVETLVERKQLFQALGFVFNFKLLDKFTPVRVLKDYVKDVSLSEILKRKKSVDEKIQFVDSQIADLRAVLRCIKEYNLESEYPSGEIEVQIGELEKLKEICRASTRLASVTRQQEQSPGKKRSSSTSPMVQQGQQRSKFQRTAEASPTPYKTPNFAPVHLQSRVSRLSPSLVNGNYGQQRAADMAANSSEVNRSSSLAYGTYGQHGQVGNTTANSVADRPSSLVSEIHGRRGQLGYMAANLAEVNPHFGTIDEVDPHFGVPNLSNPYPFKDFYPFPGRDGPF